MLKLYPMPVEITEKEGKYEFLYVNASGIENEVVLNVYSEMGISLSEANAPNVKYVKKEGLQPEEYEIIIDESGAEIAYSADNGAFYGTQTLCQLINMKTVSHLEIKDRPLLKERYISFDISRGKVPTMEYFKRIIDYLALARYNTFSLYYDRIIIQFPHLEGLWEEDAITMEELWQIKKWCNEKFIKLTISIECFGHLENFLKTDRYRHLTNSLDEANPGGDINPYHPEAMDLIETIVMDVIPFLDTEYLFINGDEITSLKTGKTRDIVAEKGVNAVYMEHIQRVCDLVKNKYGKIPVIANDMFMKGNYTVEELEKNLEAFPENAMLIDWGYESEYEYQRFNRNNSIYERKGIEFVNLASTGTFTQFIPRTYNQTLNAEVACRQAYEHNAYGAGTSCFYDGGGSNFFVIDFGGIFTFGATAWNYKLFQLSYVHSFIDKYIYKPENCEFAEIVAGLGDAAWYTKGKCPDYNIFSVAAKQVPYNSTLYWNGYHAHTGISSIHIYDMVDEWGCLNAIEHIKKSRPLLENAVLKCEYADEYKRKILLNLRMLEWAVKLSYFKLCVLVLKDYDKACPLVGEINSCTGEIIEEFPKLWITESRRARMEIFLNSMKKMESDFNSYVNNNLIREEK